MKISSLSTTNVIVVEYKGQLFPLYRYYLGGKHEQLLLSNNIKDNIKALELYQEQLISDNKKIKELKERLEQEEE